MSQCIFLLQHFLQSSLMPESSHKHPRSDATKKTYAGNFQHFGHEVKVLSSQLFIPTVVTAEEMMNVGLKQHNQAGRRCDRTVYWRLGLPQSGMKDVTVAKLLIHCVWDYLSIKPLIARYLFVQSIAASVPELLCFYLLQITLSLDFLHSEDILTVICIF